MLSFFVVLFLSVNVNVGFGRFFNRPAPKPDVRCSLVTVGYRFHGVAGQRFVYAGDVYEIPEEEWVELVAEPARDTYEVNDRHLPLDVWPRDVFGFRDVPMPRRTLNAVK